jgi:hypothetical protein
MTAVMWCTGLNPSFSKAVNRDSVPVRPKPEPATAMSDMKQVEFVLCNRFGEGSRPRPAVSATLPGRTIRTMR